MSFVDKIKSVFMSKQPAPYKQYTAPQLKVLAMKTRIYLQEYYKKCISVIQAEDSILIQRKEIAGDCYRILQEIGRHVIQVQSIKIYVQILKRIEDRSAAIIKTNGDIALLRTQLNWFQALLWYRKCKKIAGLDQLNTFCYNFFKGVDVTCQITPKCQIFKIYDILLYLDPNCIVPLKKLLPQITQYITTPIDFKVLEEIFKMNRHDIKKWINNERVQYQEKYISKSKSPIKIRSTTPKKNNNINTYSFGNNTSTNQPKISPQRETNQYQIWKQNNMKASSDSGNKIPEENRSDEKKQSTSENQNNSPQSKPQASFMRRLMQNSKIKKPNLATCIECGIQYEKQTNENGEIINVGESFGQVPSFSNLCQNCQKNILSSPQQNIEKIEPIHQLKICKRCHQNISNSSSNDMSFSSHFNSLDRNIQYDLNQFCPSCQELVKLQSQLSEQIKFEQSMQPQNTISNVEILDGIQQNIENQNNNNTQNVEKKSIFEPLSNNQVAQNMEIIAQQSIEPLQQQKFDDEQQSLRFIRESIVQKKKPVKKPYMVSIYARAEFINNIKQK